MMLMTMTRRPAVAVLTLVLVAGFTAAAYAETPILFEDVAEELGLAEHLRDWRLGHGGAWGDVTGNGRPDLFIGAFADRSLYEDPDAPLPAMLFLNEPDGFVLSTDETVQYDRRGRPRGERPRIAMALFADLNNSGKLDLLSGTHSGPPSQLFENRWPDTFRDVTPERNGWPDFIDPDHDVYRRGGFHMRNAVALDLNRNGMLDLLLIDGRYRGDRPRWVRALINKGDFQFEDATEEYGFKIEHATRGLGSAVGDVNDNGRLDLFVADSNRLFVSREDGTYVNHLPELFREPSFSDWPCGAAFADLTGNGKLDLVFTVHGNPAQIFLYVNRGVDDDNMPIFEHATEAAGLDLDFDGLGGLRGAHLALVDLDNNGRRDILLSMVRMNEDGDVQPMFLRNTGTDDDGIPQFQAPPYENPHVDAQYGLLGYYATAPVADFDRDGRIDMFTAAWHGSRENHLFRNVTDAGNYLLVSVTGEADDLNPMGIGATVRLYEAGHAGDDGHLLSRGDIAIGNGYSSGDEAIAHFGLGKRETCDLLITWQGYELTLENVQVNQHLVVPMGGE